MHLSWAKWLWQRAEDNGEINQLNCGGGVKVYLCCTPDPKVLSREVSEAVKLRELYIE